MKPVFLKKNIRIILILLLGLFIRLFRLEQTAVFVGDQGRDYLVARDILIYHRFPLLGPQTSIPWIYLGPFFYYFLAFFLWIGKFDPIWPAYGTAFFGVLAIYLIYLLGEKLFDEKAGLLSALFYAISPYAILQSRISLHPSILPVFVIFFLISLTDLSRCVKLLHSRGVALISFLVAVQLHLSAILLLPISFICWEMVRFRKIRELRSLRLLKLFMIGVFGIAAIKILKGSPFTPFSYWWKIFEEIFSYGNFFGAVLALGIVVFGLIRAIREIGVGSKIILISLVVIVCGLAVKNSQAEHYFNLFLPVIIIFFSLGLTQLWKSRFGSILVYFICAFFLISNYYLLITTNYFSKIYGLGLAERIKVAKAITDDSGKKEFELARCGPLWDYPSTNNNYEYLVWWLGGKFQKKEKSKTKNLPTYIIYEPSSSIEESEVCRNYFGIKKEGLIIFQSKDILVIKQET